MFGLCALTVVGGPADPALAPGPLPLAAFTVAGPEARGDVLAGMAMVWEQLDPAPPVVEAPAPPAPPATPTVRGTLVALAPHACIVEEPGGRQLALAVGDRWGELEVTAITLLADDDDVRVVGRVELFGSAGHQALELNREP